MSVEKFWLYGGLNQVMVFVRWQSSWRTRKAVTKRENGATVSVTAREKLKSVQELGGGYSEKNEMHEVQRRSIHFFLDVREKKILNAIVPVKCSEFLVRL